MLLMFWDSFRQSPVDLYGNTRGQVFACCIEMLKGRLKESDAKLCLLGFEGNLNLILLAIYSYVWRQSRVLGGSHR